eukprot:GGOE01061948.1.p1 GENE.GGOE01061948.1~~GGOE01061948.1.p1  ORF type:complete len:436 (-),score=102.27 GGOE01061948.1:384-1637(-)
MYATASPGRKVFTWGSGWNGRTGHNSRALQRQPTHLKFVDDCNVTKLAGKAKHMLALAEDGRVFAWGCNDWGQLGLGADQPSFLSQLYDHHMPMQVQGLPPVVSIDAGWRTSAAIDEEGQVWVWGCNSAKQLSEACKGNHSAVPIQLPWFGRKVGLSAKQVSLGHDHTAVLDEDGMLWTWGSDDYGRLGHGLKMDILGSKVVRPTMVAYFSGEEGAGREDPLPLKFVSCGSAHTLVIAETNQVFAFGKNHRNQLGCDTGVHVTKTQQFDCVFTPTPVPLLADRAFCNNVHSGAVDADGRPMIWGGSNLNPTLVRRTATRPFKSRMLEVAVGLNHVALLTDQGRIFMYGSNTFGELGVLDPWYKKSNPLIGFRTEPVPIQGLKDYNVLQVICGNRCTAALAEPRDDTADSGEETEPAK